MNEHTISIDDAFGLALIAKAPLENKDLIESLSTPHARKVGAELVQEGSSEDADARRAAISLKNWANGYIINNVSPVKVNYKNWRGEIREREIIIKGLIFGSTKWHPEEQWLLNAIDVEDNKEKQFALRDCNFRL